MPASTQRQNDVQVIKQGTWLYANEVICSLRITKRDFLPGTGDWQDEPQVADDQIGEVYFIEYAPPNEPDCFKSRSIGYHSLEEAIDATRAATHQTVHWLA